MPGNQSSLKSEVSSFVGNAKQDLQAPLSRSRHPLRGDRRCLRLRSPWSADPTERVRPPTQIVLSPLDRSRFAPHVRLGYSSIARRPPDSLQNGPEDDAYRNRSLSARVLGPHMKPRGPITALRRQTLPHGPNLFHQSREPVVFRPQSTVAQKCSKLDLLPIFPSSSTTRLSCDSTNVILVNQEDPHIRCIRTPQSWSAVRRICHKECSPRFERCMDSPPARPDR